MSERSIAEIIGWEWRGHRQYVDGNNVALSGPHWYGPETRRGMWAPPGVEVMDVGCWPNVDDMLAWLTPHGRFDSVESHHGGRPFVQVCIGAGPYTLDFYTADTMLEVLEWAIRRIDAEPAYD